MSSGDWTRPNAEVCGITVMWVGEYLFGLPLRPFSWLVPEIYAFRLCHHMCRSPSTNLISKCDLPQTLSQSPCTALTAGSCLSLGQCKGTVIEKLQTCTTGNWFLNNKSSLSALVRKCFNDEITDKWNSDNQWLILLTWFDFNPNMDK